MRPAHTLSVALCIALFSAVAAAEGPVPSGTFTVGVERITGFFHVSNDVDLPGNAGDVTIDEFAFLGAGSVTPYDLPRIAFDGFVTDGLSIGGALVFVHFSTDDASTNAFVVAPRVGYATFFSETVGIWPRGGFTYYSNTTDPDQGNGNFKRTAFALDLEVPLLIAPNPNVWITVGPVIDIGLGGEQEIDTGVAGSRSVDQKYTGFGLAAGLTAAF